MEKDSRFKEFQADKTNQGKGIAIIFGLAVVVALLYVFFPQFRALLDILK